MSSWVYQLSRLAIESYKYHSSDQILSKESILRWAYTIEESDLVVVAREKIELYEWKGPVGAWEVKATVYGKNKSRLREKKWRAFNLAEDLSNSFGNRLSFEAKIKV